MSRENADHCLRLLREADADRYIAVLYLPATVRDAAVALYAFNVEIARISSLVSEPAPGEIRLQWWRELVRGERDHGNNPVATELLRAMRDYSLSSVALENYLDARIFDLYNDPMPDVPVLEAYAGETASALLRLLVACLRPGMEETNGPIADACGHAGVALTCTAVLRALAVHRAARKCYVPATVLGATGLTVGQWFDTSPDQRHHNAVTAMCDLGREHLRRSRAAVAQIDENLTVAFLPIAVVPRYLARIRRLGQRVFLEPVELSPLSRQWALANAAIFSSGLR
jgi:15-cis-phytoene synthase